MKPPGPLYWSIYFQSVSREELGRIHEAYFEFHEKVSQILASGKGPPDEVFYFSTQYLPISLLKE